MFPEAHNVRPSLCLLFKACVLISYHHHHHHFNGQKMFGYTPYEIHLIGHSLGAHTAGEAGRRIRGIRRITGRLLTKMHS